MSKIFFFDIDGTLAVNGQIPQSNKEALAILKSKGYKTFICTGRAPFYAERLFGNLVDGIISCNGRYISYKGQKIYGKALTHQELTYFQNKINQLECGALFVSDDQSYIYHLNNKEIEMLKGEYGQERIHETMTEVPFYTFDLFYQTLKQRDQLIETFHNNLIINDHGGSGSCDCSIIDFDKGNAIAYVLDYFSLSKEDAYAFGDGYNDQAMFREVAHSIAMGNAVQELKDKATYITSSVEKQGIMNALKYEKIV